MQRFAIIMQGLPGSGKSTAARIFHHDHSVVIVDVDSIRKTVIEVTTGHSDVWHQSEIQGLSSEMVSEIEETVWKVVKIITSGHITDGKNVLIDATFTKKWMRQEFIEMFRTHGYLVTGVWVKVSLETAISRNLQRERVVPIEVIMKMAEEFEPFEESEGFDHVMVMENE